MLRWSATPFPAPSTSCTNVPRLLSWHDPDLTLQTCVLREQINVTFSMVNSISLFHSRSTDPHLPSYPMIVEITNIHNHNLHVADAVRHHDVGAPAVRKLTKLFEAGHSPSTALDTLMYDLKVSIKVIICVEF